MRQRSVNEKAVSKLINYLTDLRKDLADGIFVTGHHLQTKYAVSKSTYSVCQKLEIIVDQTWNNAFDADRKTAVKILEFLRQRSDKQTDKPISDLWCQEIAAIKELLTQVRDNTKIEVNGLDGLKMAKKEKRLIRFETARIMAASLYNGKFAGEIDQVSIDCINQTAILITDDLLSKLNS